MSSLTETRKLLVLPGNTLSFAEYLVLTVLIKKLVDKGVKVELAQIKPFPQSYTAAVSFPEVKKVDKLPPRKFILSFDKGNDVVKNIQWQQSDKRINFHISMEKGQFKPEGLNLNIEGADYDAILYYRVGSFGEVQSLFSDFPGMVHELKNISIAQQFTIDNAKVELIDFAEGANFTEKAYLVTKQLGTDTESASILLAAVLAASNRFRSNVGRKSFSYAAELVAAGASIEMANSIVERGSSDGTKSNSSSTKAGNSSISTGGKEKSTDSQTDQPASASKPAATSNPSKQTEGNSKASGVMSATRI